MPSDSDSFSLFLERLRTFPADLAAVIGLSSLTVLFVTVSGLQQTPIRTVLGLLYSLFLPGYAVVAMLFPEQEGSRGQTDERESGTTLTYSKDIDGLERVVFSVGLSIVILPLLGLLLNFTPWGVQAESVLIAVGALTVICAVLAAVRRRRLPPLERFSVPYREWMVSIRMELFKPLSRVDGVLNVLLVLSLLLAVGSIGYAAMVPQEDDLFTEFYLLTEDETGELVTDDYPVEYQVNEGRPVVIGVDNHEYESVTYSVVVQLQRVERGGDNVQVIENQELDHFETTLSHKQTWRHEYLIQPNTIGDDLRLTFLLYRGIPPENPTMENAYRDLHLWIDVEEEE